MNPLFTPVNRFYHLAQGIRVRKESFGLLFYNPRGPKLTFLHSGPWIHPEFLSGQLSLNEWIQSQFPALSEEKVLKVEATLLRALSRLIERGLVVETLGDS